jgi:hypothetical protein
MIKNWLIYVWAAIGPFALSYAECCCDPYAFRHQAYVAPEIYHVERTREQSKQQGYLYGVRFGYDYIKRYAFYFGFEGLYAQGTLKGHGVESVRVKSSLTDKNLEGRVGYTFQMKGWPHASFTPFFGIGYFWEWNHYKHPSPLKIHLDNQFCYIPVGFLSNVYLSSCFSVGVDFKARFLLSGRTKISHDDEFSDMTQNYEEKLQYRVDVPLTYYFCLCQRQSAVALVPFYEYRHYGYRAHFPFDFLDTKFKIYGVNLKLYYPF